jgi:hypothetical protein
LPLSSAVFSAIHAALGHALALAVADLDNVLADCRAARVDTEAIQASLEAPESWSFGKIIALAELSGCVPVEECTPDPVKPAFGDYTPGRFGWLLARSCGCLSPFRREANRSVDHSIQSVNSPAVRPCADRR